MNFKMDNLTSGHIDVYYDDDYDDGDFQYECTMNDLC